MPFNARCWTRPCVALVIATLLSSGCVGVGFDAPPSACPPVVNYSPAEQASVADEVAALPDGAVIVGWLADYAMLRAQVQGCSGLHVEGSGGRTQTRKSGRVEVAQARWR